VHANLDAGEKWYQKAKLHELEDEKSLISPDFCYMCSMLQTMYIYVHIQINIEYFGCLVLKYINNQPIIGLPRDQKMGPSKVGPA
jgi:hypothetical protein